MSDIQNIKNFTESVKNESIDNFYSMLHPAGIDKARADQYDSILADEEMPEKLKLLMQYYFMQLKTVKGIDNTIAKSLVVSYIRFQLMTEEERKTAVNIGWMLHGLLPEKWR